MVLEEVKFAGADEGLGAALHSKLAEEVVNVFLDGAEADHELAGDLAVGGAGSDKLQHLQLAIGQRLQHGGRGSGPPAPCALLPVP